MSEELLVRHCSPTLAGMKTGNIFNCRFADRREMQSCLQGWNGILVKKGLRALPLRDSRNGALIYVYRPVMLSQDLQCDKAREILRNRGYEAGKADGCILELRKRLQNNEEFPHEIGLFLGYPPEDVEGFIEHHAAGYKCAGCWKVYGDADAAKRQFAKYKKCTDAYCAMFARGMSIERLTVPARRWD